MIVASICLTDIPQDRITVSQKNGKKYLSIVIDANYNGADQFGNTHGIYVGQTKEEREARTRKTYIGNGKEYVFDNSQAPRPQAQQPQQAPPARPVRQQRPIPPAQPQVDVNAISDSGDSDLPF